MTGDRVKGLAGRRLLVVEDEYLIASDLADALAEMGAEVVGPAGTVADALRLVDGRLDAAVLDLNLRGERGFPVADALRARKVPFVFATGYDESSIPPAYSDVPRCKKPIDRRELIELLAAMIA